MVGAYFFFFFSWASFSFLFSLRSVSYVISSDAVQCVYTTPYILNEHSPAKPKITEID